MELDPINQFIKDEAARGVGMETHELLEQVAEAMGFQKSPLYKCYTLQGLTPSAFNGHSWVSWHPLEVNGDAFAVQVTLGITVGPYINSEGIKFIYATGDLPDATIESFTEVADDPLLAARQAIVATAAAMNKSRKGEYD